MFAISKTININIIAAWSVGLCFAIRVLNAERYIPDGNFIDVSIGASVLALGLALLIGLNPINKLGFSTLTWLALTLLITMQPFLNDIDYPDSLIFPMAGLLLATITSACVYNLPDKSQFLLHLAAMVFLVGLLSLVVQYIQLLTHPNPMPFGIAELGDYKTPFGNVTQRNQAAYVLSLSLSAWFFLYYRWRFSIILLLAVVLLLASGIGMTSSRVGVILLFAALFMLCFFCNQANKVKRFISVTIFAAFGYFFGGWLVVAYIGGSSIASGVQRLATSGVGNRLSLLQEAWWIFREHLIFGAGWGNFPKEGLKYAENLQNYIHAHHAHSLVPQIAAELGILGLLALLPMLYVFLTVVRKAYEPPRLFAVTAVVLSVLYSFTEYPLWYLGYFIPFAALVACLDTKKLWTLTSGRALSLLLLPVLLALGAVSVYYYLQFRTIANSNSLILRFQNKPEVQAKILLRQDKVFGFADKYDNILFTLMPVNENNLQQKIQLGTRVVSRRPSPNQMTRLGEFELLAGNFDKGLILFKTACLSEGGKSNALVATAYNIFINKYPGKYDTVTKEFSRWLQEQEQKKHKISVE